MSENLTILTSTTFNKAQIIATRLEALGIDCYIRNISNTQAMPGPGVKIFVKETDLENAFNTLKEFHMEINASATNVVEEAAFPALFVIPVDFSNASLNAAYYALELAARIGARIKLIHTFRLPNIQPMSFDDNGLYPDSFSENSTALKEEAEKSLSEFLQKLVLFKKSKGLKDIPISTNVINGIPDEITLYTAESESANLIIMGVAGKEVRTFEPMGKIASKIIERSVIPVMIIPEDTEFKGIDKIKNLLYATAFDESDFSAIQKLISFVSKLNVSIFCLHIDNKDATPWERVKMDGLHEYFSKVYGKTNVVCDLITSDDLLKALDGFITNHQIDIISIITHKRKLIAKLINPSITLKILYHTKIPLLVFHG